METKDAIKLAADICKESVEITKDVQEQQNVVREDIQYVLDIILRANADELKNCNSYITNKYPDLTQFTPINCSLCVVPSSVVAAMSVTQLQNSLLVAIGALNNMISSYKLLRIVGGGAKIAAKHAIEGNLK